MNLIRRLKERLQFQAYVDGFSKGYQHACKRFRVLDGRYLPYKFSDVVLGQQYVKSPRFKFRKLPWVKGFEYGYMDALSQYNAGEDAHNSDETFTDLIARVKNEFERDRHYWERNV